MKMEKDHFETCCWRREVITDPYQVFAECFSLAGIDYFRDMIKALLLNRGVRGTKKDPGKLLFDCKVLGSLLNASWVINKLDKSPPAIIPDADLFCKDLYCSGISGTSEWESFPRELSLKEYKNPYLVFKRFFGFQELDKWKLDLHDLLVRAYEKEPEETSLNLLSIYIYLIKLAEAAYLIDVREVTHIGEHVKKRFRHSTPLLLNQDNTQC